MKKLFILLFLFPLIAPAQKVDNLKVDGKIIGRWYEPKSTNATYILFEKKGIYYMEMYIQKTPIIDEVTLKKINKATTIKQVVDRHGEYYMITMYGDLQFLNKDNKVFAIGTKF